MAGTVGAIAEVVAEGLKMADKYIDDPERRAKAKIEFKLKLLDKAKNIVKEVSPDAADKALGELITLINTL